MAEHKTQSSVIQAKRHADEAARRQAEVLARLIPGMEQGRLEEADAKRIAAAVMEIMKR